jgi:hypothetical protein
MTVVSHAIYRVHEMKMFQDIKPLGTRKALLNRKGQNCFVPERAARIILFPARSPVIPLRSAIFLQSGGLKNLSTHVKRRFFSTIVGLISLLKKKKKTLSYQTSRIS